MQNLTFNIAAVGAFVSREKLHLNPNILTQERKENEILSIIDR